MHLNVVDREWSFESPIPTTFALPSNATGTVAMPVHLPL
jgi:hypothetical protein